MSEKVEYPDSTSHSLDLILIGISAKCLIAFYGFCICFVLSGFFEIFLFFFDDSLEFSKRDKCIPEFIAYRFTGIEKVDLFEISETYISDIFDTSLIFSYLLRKNSEKCRLSDAIGSDDRDTIIGIDDGMDIREDAFSCDLIALEVDIQMIHVNIVSILSKT
jgi:hypothetical protein